MAKYRKLYKVKRKKKSIFKNRLFWRGIMGLILVGEIFYVIFFFSYFQIKEIKISGNQKVRSEVIINFVHARSIFLLDSKRITENILNAFPKIFEVKIGRKFPDKLNITIKEREGVLIFCGGDNCFLLDKNGVIFEKAMDRIKLLKIQSSEFSQKLGSVVLDKNLVSLILKIESKLEDDLKITLIEITIISNDRLNAKTLDGWKIYFNPKEDLNWQLTKLKTVLHGEIPQNKQSKLEYIELRFGNLSSYKYR